MHNNEIHPHGGCGLINRILPEVERQHHLSKIGRYKEYTINNGDLSVFYRIADGTLSPLDGPMDRKEFCKVLNDEVIERGGKKYAWTIPIAFPISKKESKDFKVGETIIIKNKPGIIVGTLEITDIYPFDKNKYNKSIYGTDRKDHPGPAIVNNDPRDYLLGGKIWAFPQLNHPVYGKYMLDPEQARRLFRQRGWERIVAFQTRNPLHRAHEYALVYALEKLTKEGVFTGAVLNPLVGATKTDDVPADIRMRTYEVLIEKGFLGKEDKDEKLWKKKKYDLVDQLLLIGLDMKMFYAGPKEAIMHAIYRQNLGFTDIIIGRKHADAPFDDGTPVWGDFEAHKKFDNLNGELLVRPVKVGFAAFYEELGRVGLMDEFSKKGYHAVGISGKELRQKLQKAEDVDERIMRKPVADILRQFYKRKKKQKSTNIKWHDTGISKTDREERNDHRGAVIWLTGLPSCGKSTIAVELQAALFEMGCSVYILDGDNIRHGINQDLGFSPEDREENIRRIGEIAKLFSDAGVLVITSFISPYRRDRDNARGLLAEGDFIEVYVKAKLATCEKRDIKGLYKKARNGEIQDFTGISAPYEEPKHPEIITDTDKETKEESARRIFDYLADKGYIQK